MLAARARGARHGRVLKYMHSGEISGDNSGVVGYLAGAPWGASPMFTEAQQRELVAIARDAVRRSGDRPPAPRRSTPATVSEASGAFVTLKKHGQLRGCIGTLECRRPLAEEVARVAVSAAREDPRFEPVRAVRARRARHRGLGARAARADRSARPGGHRHRPPRPRRRTGQAARAAAAAGRHRMGLDRETFLAHTCTKAGLAGRRLEARARTVYRFAAEVFGD